MSRATSFHGMPAASPTKAYRGFLLPAANRQRGIEESRTGGHNPALAEKRIWQRIRRSACRDKRTELGELECERLGADGKVTAYGRDSLLRLDKPNATAIQFLGCASGVVL